MMIGRWFLVVFATAMMGLMWMFGVKPMAVETTEKNAFIEQKVLKIGDHTYYPADLFSERKESGERREEILLQMQKADATLTDDVFVTGYNSMIGTGDFHLFGYLITGGVVNGDLSLASGYNPADDSVMWGSHRYGLLSLVPRPETVDCTGLIPAEEACRTAFSLAQENKAEMFRFRREEPICGTYALKTNREGRVFYEFVINRFSNVRIDAKTGEVLRVNFWSGVYED